MAMSAQPAIDGARLNAFVGRMLGDLGALTNAVLVHVGDQLGLYKAITMSGPTDSTALAKQTGTSERLVREWLSAQAAQGYLSYDKSTQKFSLSPEQAMVFADDDSPFFMAGFFDIANGLFHDVPKIVNAFKSDGALAWHEHNGCLFCGTQRIFRPAYNHSLVKEWLPALDGVVAKLQQGCSVADVGCGLGASTILMAKAFPNSKFFGYDYHPESIEAARKAAREADVGMGDPAGAAHHVSKALAPDGTWMIVEPFAHDRLEDNLNPVGALFYAASTVVCTPASLAQEVGLALGAQAGEARLKKVIMEGGFRHVRRAAETPFNMVLEARL